MVTTTPTPVQPPGLDQVDQAIRDYRVEQFLRHYLDPSEFYLDPAVPLEALDLHSALRAQVRPAAADGTLPHLVQRYAIMRRSGTKPPAGIAHLLDNARFELLDARQRVESLKFVGLDTTMPMYVVTTQDEEKLWTVALRANEEINGEPPSDADVEKQVLAHKDHFPNTSNVDLGHIFKRTEHAIGDILLRARISDRLGAMGFKTQQEYGPKEPEAKYFTAGTIKRLSSLKDDAVLKATAQLVTDAGLTTKDVNALVTELNDQRSEQERLTMITAKRSANGIPARIERIKNGANLPPPEHPVRDRLMRKVDALDRDVSRYKSAAEAEMTDPKIAADFWGAVIRIETAARRIVGPIARK